MAAQLCGAKTRSGAPCRAFSMPNGRCRKHGGKSTGAPKKNANALQHGIYAVHFTPEEIDLAGQIQLGRVDDELRLMRLRLRRALAAEEQAQGNPEVDEVVEREQGGEAVSARKETKSKVRDYVSIVDKIMARIESLERTRVHLIADGDGAEDPPSADSLTPGEPDEQAPPAPVR